MESSFRDGIAETRRLNDELRSRNSLEGQIVVSPGIQELGALLLPRILDAVTGMEDSESLSKDHSYGQVAVDRYRIAFRINCLDRETLRTSPRPEDQENTHRVLTIMLVGESEKYPAE